MTIGGGIYFVILASFGISFSNITYGSKHCFEYVECEPKDQCGCGRKIKNEHAYSLDSNARIINAKTPNSHIYPWMAQVQRKCKTYNPNDITFTGFQISKSGGVIINQKSILTVGHNICIDIHSLGKGPIFPHPTCPYRIPNMPIVDWDRIRMSNLNTKGTNELTYRVGSNLGGFDKLPYFNPKVSAYLYDYDSIAATFSNNGDIGLLVIDGGISEISQRMATPICLPIAHQFFLPRVPVNFVGWGNHHFKVESSTIDGKTKTSYQTNHARIHEYSQISSATTFENRIQFLDCEIKRAPDKFCNNWLLEQSIDTLSIKTDLTNIENAGTDDEKKIKLRNMEDHKRCEIYMEKARESWINDAKKPDSEFDETVDRIVIEDKSSGKTEPEVCYNLKKVAKYGYCKTNKPQPRNWGFCSRSCDYFPRPQPDNNGYLVGKSYEEEEFNYFEENPIPAAIRNVPPFTWWNNDHMRTTFKCIGSIIPRATNAFFTVNKKTGHLNYVRVEDDVLRPEGEYGQIGLTNGDSGSPFVYEENGQSYLLAIQSSVHISKSIPQGYHTNSPGKLCNGIATKITEDILFWTQQHANN